ncbi:hypothetical protein ACGFWI_34295 [Streptomyces sp. NPDC048434]|uniref:hypothetical protein n=1 Tax=Streptomyces sp. NPDC048434 TaxID=3365549 RepID=UPI003713E75D
MHAIPVVLPWGIRYWTVVDDDLVVVAIFRLGRPARDRLIMLLATVSLRPGQVAGLRRCDLHLVDSRSLGATPRGRIGT